jgi:hypothetical protein
MPRKTAGEVSLTCTCCESPIVIGYDPHIHKKVWISGCCAGPVCDREFYCTRACRLCKKDNVSWHEFRKTCFPFSSCPWRFPLSQFSASCPLTFSWEKWIGCVDKYTTLMRTPQFQEFLESCQSPLQWHDHLRLTKLFHEYIFLRPASLQLASMVRMRMCMRLGRSNASVFGSACHKITQMLDLCRANEVRVIHPRRIHAHFGIAFLCATRISTELDRRKSEDGSVAVCSNTYWHTMIPWIIRWITRLPK